MKKILLFVTIVVFGALVARAQFILPLKEQSRVIDELLAERLNHLLPALMKEEGISSSMKIILFCASKKSSKK